ncbi:hypothetical protein DXG01_012599 [Tephrocybe rancida]|nr:hypothetical protein DXG01_012599 [Tephrocybe rancida]
MGLATNIDDSDYSVVSYKGAWIASGTSNEFDGTTHGTRDAGAQATVKFKGTSIAVFGTIAYGRLGNASAPNSSYTLDNATPTLFSGFPPSINPAYERQFYLSPILDPAVEHTLVITLVATGGNMFWLDRFLVGSDSVPVTTTSDVPKLSPTTIAGESGGVGVTTVTATESGSTLPTSPQTSNPISTTSQSLSMSDSFHFVPTPTLGPVTESTDLLAKSQSSTSAGSASSSNASHYSRNTTIGIAVGVVAGIIFLSLVSALLFCFLQRRNLEGLRANQGVSPFQDSRYVMREGQPSKTDPRSGAQQATRQGEALALAELPPPVYQEVMPLISSR